MNTIQKNKERRKQKDPRGSVLIMTLIITSGMLMIGIEFSTFIASAIRASRNSDRALIARYAAESALESGLYELRKDEHTVLINTKETIGSASWTYEDDAQHIDPNKFSQSIPAFYKSLAAKDSVTQFGLYTITEQGTGKVENLKTLLISWDGIDANCTQSQQPPGIEVSVLGWNAGAVDWSSADVHKVFKQAETIATKSAEIDLSLILDSQNQPVSDGPLVARIKPYFCDLSHVKISLPDPNDVNKTIPIPNYFLLNPLGVATTVQQNVQAIVPAQGSISDIFDFALFSDEQITKAQ